MVSERSGGALLQPSLVIVGLYPTIRGAAGGAGYTSAEGAWRGAVGPRVEPEDDEAEGEAVGPLPAALLPQGDGPRCHGADIGRGHTGLSESAR
jgi:hypothetical protein